LQIKFICFINYDTYMSWSYQWSLMSLITGNKVKKKHTCQSIVKKKRTKPCAKKKCSNKNDSREDISFINIWITKVKLFWKKSGTGVLTLQCNSYLSHVRSFFKISSPISFHPCVKLGPEQSWHHFNGRLQIMFKHKLV
jgi:hypothetical protein